MELRAGMRLKSVVCETQIVIVKPPRDAAELRCGGVPMVGINEQGPDDADIAANARGGTQLGKRYVSEGAGLEVLCTKAGEGSLALGEEPLATQGAKPLPPSD